MLKKTVLVHALTLAFSGAALTMAVVQPAMAQSNATGNIYGRVAAIDVSNANNGATFTAKELAALPIGRNVARSSSWPRTPPGDPRYAGGASFGGGGASENAYYINGFPVTNPLTSWAHRNCRSARSPRHSILTGGFGAEFGRSIGGVVNITTKSGTNNWEAGAMASTSIRRICARRLPARTPSTWKTAGKRPRTCW
jgi:hypothetical protein